MNEKNNLINFEVDIDGFNGPLDLLDNLIKDKKMNILNLDISILANQYFNFIKNNISKINIDKLSSYLVMSTYLLQLKSKKILLLSNELNTDSNDFEYERDKLVSQIIEYRKYKDISEKLFAKQQKRIKLFSFSQINKNNKIEFKKVYQEKLPAHINPQKLIASIIGAYEKYKFSLFNNNRILVQELSVDEIEKDLIEYFKNNNEKELSFSNYLENVEELKITNQYVVTCFLALLELVKYHLIDLIQNDKNDEIFIKINDLNNENFLLNKGDN